MKKIKTGMLAVYTKGRSKAEKRLFVHSFVSSGIIGSFRKGSQGALNEKMTVGQDLKEVREWVLGTTGPRASQARTPTCKCPEAVLLGCLTKVAGVKGARGKIEK